MLNSKIKGTKNTVSEQSKIKKIISLLSTAKKMLNSKIKGQNTLKRVSSRGIKSLENIINTFKIVTEPKVVTQSKKVSKPKVVDKPEIVIENKYPNYDEYKNHAIKQLKKTLKKVAWC